MNGRPEDGEEETEYEDEARGSRPGHDDSGGEERTDEDERESDEQPVGDLDMRVPRLAKCGRDFYTREYDSNTTNSSFICRVVTNCCRCDRSTEPA